MAENNLRTLIFTTNAYQIQARPASTVVVNITLNIITFNSLDVRNQALTTTGYFSLTWSDARLDWSINPTYNSDIHAIYSDEDTIWRPPIILENSVSDISVMSDDSIPIRVINDGTLSWTPSGIYVTLCETDVTFYPFDTQECDISVSTWGYTASEITLALDSSPLDFTYFKENGEWAYKSYTTSTTDRGRGGNSFSSVTFHLNLKRRPMYHVLNTLTPTILLAFLSCMAFKLPAESGERIGYSLTVLLSYAVYLTLVADNIPTTSVNTSLLSVYLVFILALGMISVLLTILVLECHHSDPDTAVPKWLLKTVSVLMMLTLQKRKEHSRCWCCSCVRNRNNIGSMDMSKEVSENTMKESKTMDTDLETKNTCDVADYTWLEVGRLLDKSFLRIFLFIVLIVTFTFMMALGIGYAIY
ncbi:acetylcholine receptor subunit alpha-like [Ylistrum balloti]|uniref:acetylcholine receptor subunit alpha-like n=1 Tax=Ylistrum balloti TaxID=509963 RepID=UPI002905DE6E|nr:acetylcholine receptor subunit alpha-like [Ylistrum balloti]